MLGESVRAFVPHALPPSDPALSPEVFNDLNRQAELALARLAGVSGLVPSVDWLLYSAIRKEALLTSQIEGTQATLTDLFDEEAGFKVSNTDDVEEVTNYLRAFRWTQEQLRDPQRAAHQRAALVRGAPTPAGWGTRRRQATGGAAPVAKLDWRHTARQCGFRTAAAGARSNTAGRYGAVHSRRSDGPATDGQGGADPRAV
jgi:hypothetical protein